MHKSKIIAAIVWIAAALFLNQLVQVKSYEVDGSGDVDSSDDTSATSTTKFPTRSPTTPKPTMADIITEGRPNILMIIADDLNAQFGPYASNSNPLKKGNHTPNFDRLASQSVTFLNAYAQISVCGPSRQSFLSGRSPDTTKIYSFERWLPQASPLMTTLPKYLKDSMGYFSYGIGKIFHDNSNSPMGDLWTTLKHFSAANPTNLPDGNSECGDKWYCTITGLELIDETSSNSAIKFIQNAQSTGRLPFFLAVGFRRPHLTNALPAGLIDTISFDDVDYPNLVEPNITGIPNGGTFRQSLARFVCSDETRSRQIRTSPGVWEEVVNPAAGRKSLNDLTDKTDQFKAAVLLIRQSYYAAIKWLDVQVGKILDALIQAGHDANTIIIFTSDHGFSNGDKGVWCKNSLYERTNKVPLMVRLPKNYEVGYGVRIDGAKRALRSLISTSGTSPSDPSSSDFDDWSQYLPKPESTAGMTSNTLVQLLDIFPTIIELIGGPKAIDSSKIPLDGTSFVKSLIRPNLVSAAASYSQYPRCAVRGISQSDACTDSGKSPCSRQPIRYMGYSIRTATHRYVEWREFNEEFLGCTQPNWVGKPTTLISSELIKIINADRTRTIWTSEPVELELYANYSNSGELGESEDAIWETRNLAFNPSPADRQLMRELSRMIRYKFDPSAKKTVCSGKGLLKLVPVTKGEEGLHQSAVVEEKEACECMEPWGGSDCARVYTKSPTAAPTQNPTKKPTANPTKNPTSAPTTPLPTKLPTTAPTTVSPTASPTKKPATRKPSQAPTSRKPTVHPTTKNKTTRPSTPTFTSSPTSANIECPDLISLTECIKVPKRNGCVNNNFGGSCTWCDDKKICAPISPTMTESMICSNTKAIIQQCLNNPGSMVPTSQTTKKPTTLSPTVGDVVTPAPTPYSTKFNVPTSAPRTIPIKDCPTESAFLRCGIEFVTKKQCETKPADKLCMWCNGKCLPGNVKEVCNKPDVYVKDCYPTKSPTLTPTFYPSPNPTKLPSNLPTTSPTLKPTTFVTPNPTYSPTGNPSFKPTADPTRKPGSNSTLKPTRKPA